MAGWDDVSSVAPQGGGWDAVSSVVDQPVAQLPKPASFLAEMKGNLDNGIQSGKDLLSGNWEDIGATRLTPKTQALGDKLFPSGSDGSFSDMAKNTIANTKLSDWTGATLEKFGDTPEGKALSVIGGVLPHYNAASTVINRYVNPAIEKTTGIAPDNLQFAELLAGTTGLKNAGKINDPLVTAAKSAANRISNAPALFADESSGGVISPKISSPIDTPAYQKVYSKLASEFNTPEELQTFLNSYASTKGQSLAEKAGSPTRGLAEASAQFPAGSDAASNFFKQAVDIAPDKLKGSVNKNISPDINYHDTIDNVMSSGREEAAPLYKDAFTANQSINDPIINRILQTPEGRSALGEASKNMQNEMSLVARPDPEMTAMAKELSDIGMMDRPEGGVASGLKLKTLDYIKKSMDSTINKAYRAGDDGEASRIRNLKNGLLDRLDANDTTGLYSKARSTSGDYFSVRDAMDSGTSFIKDDPELVKRSYDGFSPIERRAYKSGVMKSLRDQIDNTTDGRNVANFINKQSMRDKLQAVLSPREYSDFIKNAEAVDNIYKLRNQVTGNSRTMLRKAAMDELTSNAADTAIDVMTKGATRTAIDTVITAIQKKFSGLNDKTAGEVSQILFETDPKKKYQIVKNLYNISQSNSPEALAAKSKLNAFYGMADIIKERRSQIIPAASIPQKNEPLRITITPKDKLPVQENNNPSPQSNASPLFQRVIQAESRGNQSAVSNKGAIGVAQIMPATAKEAAQAAGLPYDPFKLRTDKNYNAALGQAYLGKLQSKYKNDALALAAYNWGMGNVDMWLKSGANPAKLPKETQAYLTRILG